MRYLLLTCLLLAFSICCKAQFCKLLTSDKELSSSLINEILQDSDGMIWIATEDGLNRYDGVKSTIYKHDADDEHSLLNNFVRMIFEDSKRHILVGSHEGLQLYDPAADNFSKPAAYADGTEFNSNIVSIVERKNGEIWVSGDTLVKLTIDGQKLIVEHINLHFKTPETDFMTEDSRGNMWVLKAGEGVYRVSDDGKVKRYLETMKEMTLTRLAADSHGDVFVATMGNGLLRYDHKKDQFLPVSYNGKEDLCVKTLYPLSKDELLLGTDGWGVKLYNGKNRTITDYLFDNYFFDSSTAKVHSILRDDNGNFWFAIYQKGVIMVPSQANNFKYIGYKSTTSNIIGSNYITCICKSHDGTTWIGTDNDGIYGIRDGRQRCHFPAGKVPPTVMNIFEDSRGTLWVGSYTQGMGRLDSLTGQYSPVQGLKDKYGNKVQRVYQIVEDSHQQLWAATMGSGLFYIDPASGEARRYESPSGAVNDWIGCLYHHDDGRLYCGTYNGVTIINTASDPSKGMGVEKTILEGKIAFSICGDSKGGIWIGCSNGLYCYNSRNGDIKLYTTKDGLPSNTIYGIQEDLQGNLWISTNYGLARLYTYSGKFVNYYVTDGLQSNEFSKNATFKDERGNIWFGGTNGITFFNPQEIVNPTRKWHIRITDFYVHNQPVRCGMKSGRHEIIDRPVYEAEEFHLAHSDNSFTIEFSTCEMNSPERITYMYSLNNRDWISLPVSENHITFSNMKPGAYSFRIRAVDGDLLTDTKEITIYVASAWYASWWAKLIYLLLVLYIIRYLVLQAKHKAKIKMERLEHLHSEQINEAKLQFFINISHEIRTPMSLIISPLQQLIKTDKDSKRQQAYQTIYRNAERILRLINQLMDIRKLDKGKMALVMRDTEIVGFIADICDTFSERAKERNLALAFHHDGIDTMNVWVDPDNFDKIMMNLLSNAFKFTPAGGTVDIYLHTVNNPDKPAPLDNCAEIIVADSGIGIEPREREQIFDRFYQIRNNANNSQTGTGIGLHLTRSLVELHHGTIKADGNPEGKPGTRFIIDLPLGNSHLRGDEMDSTPAIASEYVRQKMKMMAAPAITHEEDPEVKQARSKHHIMVVDDNEEIRQYICNELSSDYRTIECSNGKEALEMIFKKMPSLVICDVMMPEMDGMTFCHKVKQNPNLNHIPVILLTAKTREEDNIEGLEMGADAYVTKPFNIDILKKTCDNLIKSRARLRNTFTGQQTRNDKLEKITMPSADDKLMERIMKVINDNLSDPNLSVATICEGVGISRVHLHRKLKELTNQTTRDFIRNTRLRQAASLMEEKHYSVNEIAEKTGFSNPSNFSTAFKELFGMTPTAYMDAHQNGGKQAEAGTEG